MDPEDPKDDGDSASSPLLQDEDKDEAAAPTAALEPNASLLSTEPRIVVDAEQTSPPRKMK